MWDNNIATKPHALSTGSCTNLLLSEVTEMC